MVDFAFFNILQNLGELVAQEDGNNGRRRFVGAQAVVIGIRSHGGPQNVGVFINGADGGDEEDQKLDIVMRCFARGSTGCFPLLSDKDQFTCLPEPLIPAKGFSWSRHASLCFFATDCIVSMTIWL